MSPSKEIIQAEEKAKEKWVNNNDYKKLIIDLKNNSSTLRKMDPTDPKINIEKIKCAELVKQHPIWEFLDGVVGISYTIAGTILSQIDLLKIHYVSQIYSYCGISKDKKSVSTSKRPYKIYLKKALMTDLVSRFIRIESEYALYYYSRVLYLINRDLSQISEGEMCDEVGQEIEGKLKRHDLDHIKNMAKRYMIQKFLRDFYEAGRTIMGMPLINGYAQSSDGIIHSGDDLTDWKQFINVPSDKFKIRRAHTRKQIQILKNKIEFLEKISFK